MSKWNGDRVGIEMKPRSSSSRERREQLQEIVHRAFLDSHKKTELKIQDWEMVETEEEWRGIPVKLNSPIKTLTEEQAINYVGKHARYYAHGVPLPGGKFGGMYAVEAPDGRLLHNDDTRTLVMLLSAERP